MTKKLLRVSLITITLMLLLACFRFTYASVVDKIVEGLGTAIVGALTWSLQYFALLIFGALDALTNVITGLASGNAASLADIVFNKCALTSANFFDAVWVGAKPAGGIENLTETISEFYYIIRNLSIAILLGVLIYIGIRMAISTVASDEAKYKKMLFDWVISLILVFVLHFIIIITFFINNQLVAVLANTLDPHDDIEMLELIGNAAVPGAGLDELMVYGAFVIAKFTMALTYIRRTIVLGFLIVISPLITITYAIDKMGDGKSQALNTWLKEFVFTVIIQPFHCIIYIVFYETAIKSIAGFNSDESLGIGIFAALSAFFMLKAEGIVKKIFGIQPSGIGDAIGAGAMAITAATSLFGKNKGNKVDKSKGKMPNMKNNIDKKDEKNGINRDKDKENEAKDSENVNAGNAGTSGATATAGTGSSASGSAGTAGGSAGAESAVAASSASTSEKSGKDGRIKRAIKGIADRALYMPIGGGFGGKRAYERNGGFTGMLGRNFSRGATLAGMIAGGTVGDLKAAVSVGTASGSIASNLRDNHEYRRAEEQIENNQEVFAGAYEDFANAYREEFGDDVDDNEIRNAAKKIFDGNGQDLETEYERDFYSQMEQLATSAEIIGYKNGYDYIDSTMRKVQNEVILPGDNYVQKRYGKPVRTKRTKNDDDE